MTALTTWTIDAGVVRRIRSIFHDRVAAVQPAKPAAKPQPRLEPISHHELPEPGDRPVPIHVWRRFYAVLHRVLEPFPSAFENLSRAVLDDPLLREEALA